MLWVDVDTWRVPERFCALLDPLLEAPAGVFLSETVMAARGDSRAEDDGYLITFVSDVPNDRSECWILDASCPSDGPLARISLPERISSGTHATWWPGADAPRS